MDITITDKPTLYGSSIRVALSEPPDDLWKKHFYAGTGVGDIGYAQREMFKFNVHEIWFQADTAEDVERALKFLKRRIADTNASQQGDRRQLTEDTAAAKAQQQREKKQEEDRHAEIDKVLDGFDASAP